MLQYEVEMLYTLRHCGLQSNYKQSFSWEPSVSCLQGVIAYPLPSQRFNLRKDKYIKCKNRIMF